jgi:hypothetical protein
MTAAADKPLYVKFGVLDITNTSSISYDAYLCFEKIIKNIYF